MQKKLQVFISSTFTDLIEERQVAVKAILNAGHIPAGMELFTAGDESQKEIIKRWIEESDAYMLVLGGRYGSIDGETGKSYTHWEYDYAGEIGKPRFALVLSDYAIQKKIESLGFKDATEQTNPQQHKEFRSELLQSKLINPIDDFKDIEISIFKSLKEIEQRSDLAGWVSGRDVPDVQDILRSNQKLLEENEKLKKEVTQLKERDKRAILIDGVPFEDIYKYLKTNNIKLPEYVNDEESEASLLVIFQYYHDVFATGIYNKSGIDNLRQFLYFKVAPKLMTFGLLDKTKIAGVKYEKIQTSKEGLKFIAQCELLRIKNLSI